MSQIVWVIIYIVWYFTPHHIWRRTTCNFSSLTQFWKLPPKTSRPLPPYHQVLLPTYYTRPRPIPTLWQFKPKYVKYMGASKPASKPRKALDHCPSCPPANPLSDKGVRSTDRSSGPWRPLAPAQGWPLMLWLVLEASATPASPCYLPYVAHHLMLHLLEPEKITHLRFFAPQPKLAVSPREGEGLIAGV